MGKTHSGTQPRFFPPDGKPVPPAVDSRATTTDKGHGRQARRTLRRTTRRTKTQDGAGLKQGFAGTRERTIQGVTPRETVYGIPSWSVAEAEAGRLLALTRGHWEIENGLHDKRDVTLQEDASRVRREGTPQVLAALRNRIIQLLERRADSLAAAVRIMRKGFDQARTLLGLPQLD